MEKSPIHGVNQQERPFDVGWLVGIIDGEGCFVLGKRPNSFAPAIQITNTNLRIIQKAKNILSDLNLTCYFYTRLPKKGRPYYRLEIYGHKRVKKLLDKLLPYMDCRREQAQLLYDFVSSRLSKQSHSPTTDEEREIHRKLAEVNKNGIPRDYTLETP